MSTTDSEKPISSLALQSSEHVGVVVIGRNEGERLMLCLNSLVKQTNAIVYVDSGSNDGSAEKAAKLGAIVALLDDDRPFTAGRARNLGLSILQTNFPDLKVVQFVDGDCEVVSPWLETGLTYLVTHPSVGAVAGQRRERFPEHSIYNCLINLEWRTPPGPSQYFGGDVMIRITAITEAGGYRESLIAGEDPELALRITRAGWGIMILEDPMTLHDANMTRFSQWWRRTKRAGYAFAEGSSLHGAGSEGHWVRESRRSIYWSLLPTAATALGLMLLGPFGLLALLAYPLQFLRLVTTATKDLSVRSRSAWAFFTTIGKFAEFNGHLNYWLTRAKKRHSRLIEYK